MPITDEDPPVIYLETCCECGQIVRDWLPFPTGPVCWGCLARDDEEDTAVEPPRLYEPEYGGESG